MTQRNCGWMNGFASFPFRRWLFRALAVLVATNVLAQTTPPRAPADLTLEEFLKRVVERNESIQNKILEVEFNRRRLAAEYGAFEPAFFANASHVVNERENTVEQRNNQSVRVFEERNNIYEGGIESLVPTGARLRLGYTLRELNNNLLVSSFPPVTNTNTEYQTFFGLSFLQPLMKGAWLPANLAGIRVAALSSDLAFQDYRRQMMVLISTAIASYWELYLAQEQWRFFDDSVATAGKILADNRARQQAGRGSELEVMEAGAGLALRRSKLGEAEQKLYEAANKMLSLASTTVLETNRLVRAADVPLVRQEQFSFLDAWQSARAINPDVLSQRLKAAQEMVRLAYAKNQRLPELNLKASYGLNGLGLTPAESWDDIQQGGFPSWTIGAEFRVPLAGDLRGRNELRAAYLRHQQARLGMREVETQIANALDTALQKVRSARNSVASYQTVVEFNRQVLDSALVQLELGRMDSRKILEIEASLLDARNSLAVAHVQCERAALELELLQGSLLRKHGFDLTQSELQSLTAGVARQGHLTDEQYQDFIRKVQTAYETKALGPHAVENPAQRAARRDLEAQMNNWPATNPPAARPFTPSTDPAREALRKKIEELRKQDETKP